MKKGYSYIEFEGQKVIAFCSDDNEWTLTPTPFALPTDTVSVIHGKVPKIKIVLLFTRLFFKLIPVWVKCTYSNIYMYFYMRKLNKQNPL